jgi:hypothetical protein
MLYRVAFRKISFTILGNFLAVTCKISTEQQVYPNKGFDHAMHDNRLRNFAYRAHSCEYQIPDSTYQK